MNYLGLFFPLPGIFWGIMMTLTDLVTPPATRAVAPNRLLRFIILIPRPGVAVAVLSTQHGTQASPRAVVRLSTHVNRSEPQLQLQLHSHSSPQLVHHNTSPLSCREIMPSSACSVEKSQHVSSKPSFLLIPEARSQKAPEARSVQSRVRNDSSQPTKSQDTQLKFALSVMCFAVAFERRDRCTPAT